ncbi:MAG TPA: hypothetical protein VIM65_06240 [Cyclobacteriaceae bacterium]
MKIFLYFAYVMLITLGGIAIGITYDGHIVIICIACGGLLQTLIGTFGILTGAIGIGRLAMNKDVVSTQKF